MLADGDLKETAPLAVIRARHKTMGAAWNPAAIPALADARRELGAIGGDDERSLATRAAAAVVAYARATQPAGTVPIGTLALYRPGDAVVLDEAAIANLEIIETLVGRNKHGSLLDIIDQTSTAPGARLLRRWLLYCLVDVARSGAR